MSLIGGKYLFHIGRENDNYFNRGVAIYITPKDYWDENESLAEHYTEDEIEELTPILEDLGLAEVMQSVYESIKPIKLEALRSKMLNVGFIEDEKYSIYIESFVEKEDDWYDDGDDSDDDSYHETYED